MYPHCQVSVYFLPHSFPGKPMTSSSQYFYKDTLSDTKTKEVANFNLTHLLFLSLFI